MLSSVAERVYWMARYLERVENTARLVGVYAELTLDLPRELELDWFNLILINDSEALFDAHYRNRVERNVVKFMLADEQNPGSMRAALKMARENVRTTRDTLPVETWEQINELYLFATERVNECLSKRNRYEYLNRVIMSCQQLNGMFDGTMAHDAAWDFLRLGRNIERADMTTRILDVGAAIVGQAGDEEARNQHLQHIVWLSVLKSVSAYLVYRKLVRVRVSGEQATRFLLEDTRFPRAVSHCLSSLSETIAGLPRQQAPLKAVRAIMQRTVGNVDYDHLGKPFREEMDRLQIELADLHQSIQSTWFAVALRQSARA